MPLPTQAEAVQLVQGIYNDYFKASCSTPPIYWRRDQCGRPNGIYGPDPVCVFVYNGEVVSGTFVESPGNWIEAGAPSFDPPKVAVTDLPHEMLHATMQCVFGDADEKHSREEWWDSLPVQSFQIKVIAAHAVAEGDL